MALQIRKRHLKLKQMAPKKIWVLIYIYFVSIILIQAQIKSDKTISEIISDAQNIHSNNVLESNFKIISKKILYSSFEFENFEGKNNDSTNRKFFEISYSKVGDVLGIKMIDKNGLGNFYFHVIYTETKDTILLIDDLGDNKKGSFRRLNSILWKNKNRFFLLNQRRLDTGFFSSGIQSLSEFYILDSQLVPKEMITLSEGYVMSCTTFRYYFYVNDVHEKIKITLWGLSAPVFITYKSSLEDILVGFNKLNEGFALAGSHCNVSLYPELKYYWRRTYEYWINTVWDN